MRVFNFIIFILFILLLSCNKTDKVEPIFLGENSANFDRFAGHKIKTPPIPPIENDIANINICIVHDTIIHYYKTDQIKLCGFMMHDTPLDEIDLNNLRKVKKEDFKESNYDSM